MSTVNLRSFRARVRHNKSAFRRYLSRIEKNAPHKLDELSVLLDKQVWSEIDCLSCANCCKKMSPTFTWNDTRRIAAHLGMSVNAFRKKWLYKEKRGGDWLNRTTPCQFLDLKTNMCSIYEVRPGDCSGFPHLMKKKMVDYIHVHKQNLEYCPATYKMVERMKEALAKDEIL